MHKQLSDAERRAYEELARAARKVQKLEARRKQTRRNRVTKKSEVSHGK